MNIILKKMINRIEHNKNALKTKRYYVEDLISNEELIILVEEIERLNNIINELEKWVVESIEKYTEDYLDWKYDRNVYLAGSKKLQNVLDKLQELKGSEKE